MIFNNVKNKEKSIMIKTLDISIVFLALGVILGEKFIINTSFFVGALIKVLWIIKYKINLFKINEKTIDFKLLILMILFCTAFCFVSFYAVDINVSIKFAEYYFKWMVIPFFMVCFLGIGLNDFHKYIMIGLCLAGIIDSTFVIWNSLFLEVERPGGLFDIGPNLTAGLLIFILPFVVLNKLTSNIILKLLIIVLIITGVILTGSRGGIIAGLVEIILLLFYLWKNNSLKIGNKPLNKKVFFISMVAIFLVVAICGINNERFSQIIKYKDSLIEHRVGGDRILLWKSTLKMIEDYPLFGVGIRNFNKVYIEKNYIDEAAKEPDLISPHNIYLHILVESGIIGTVAFFSLLAYQLKKAYQYAENDNLMQAYLSALIGMSVHGLVDYLFLVKIYYQFYWFMSGCIFLYLKQNYQNNKDKFLYKV